MKRLLPLLTAAAAMVVPASAFAQDTVDLGTLRNEEITVVQKLLYPKEGRSEVHMMVGGIVSDPYMRAPKLQLGYGKHMSESLAWEVALGAGYGIGTSAYRELSGPAYGVAPEAYRYLGSATAGVTWSPVYAKMNWQGNKIFHHDVYVPIVGGVTVERLAWGAQYFAVAPTVGVGVGIRIFQGDSGIIRLEVRDDVIVENRKQSGTIAIKQNVNVLVGFSRLGKKS